MVGGADSSFYEPKDKVELCVALVSRKTPPRQWLNELQDIFLNLTQKIEIAWMQLLPLSEQISGAGTLATDQHKPY